MEIRNLTPKNTEEVEGFLEELSKKNAGLEWETFPMRSDTTFVPQPLLPVPEMPVMVPPALPDPTINVLREEIAMLRQKIELIFGGHVLLNGRWVKL